MSGATFVVHIDADGNPDYLAFGSGDARFLVVDERCPGDRVYSITRRLPRSQLDALVKPGEVIGHLDDARGVVLAARIRAAAAGVPHLSAVEPQ